MNGAVREHARTDRKAKRSSVCLLCEACAWSHGNDWTTVDAARRSRRRPGCGAKPALRTKPAALGPTRSRTPGTPYPHNQLETRMRRSTYATFVAAALAATTLL